MSANTTESERHSKLSTHGRSFLSKAVTAARRYEVLILQIAFALTLLVTWEFLALQFKTEFYTSSPSEIGKQLVRWNESGLLLSDMRITLFEAGLGFLLGSIFGAAVGFVLGWIRRLGDIFEPFVLALYSLPKIALAPLFVLWFGIGVTNKVIFSAVLVFFMVFFTTFQGTRQVDKDLIENVKLLGANRFQCWSKVVVPFSAIWVFTGLRIGLPYALIGAIVGEFVAADAGVGFRIREATSYFNTAGVFAGLLLLMIISMVLLNALRLLERRILRWQTADMLSRPQPQPEA